MKFVKFSDENIHVENGRIQDGVLVSFVNSPKETGKVVQGMNGRALVEYPQGTGSKQNEFSHDELLLPE
jgi:hypothetical protein